MHSTLCQILKNRPATIHLTAIDDEGEVIEIHLSAAAVRKLNIDLHNHPPSAEQIHLWLDQADEESPESPEDSPSSLALKAPTLLVSSSTHPGTPSCETCGLSYESFLETNRFGCAACYGAFTGQLDRALKDLHGHNRHTGRVPRGNTSHLTDLRMERDQLRRRLADAVADEAYEEAAEMRDRLRRIESDLHDTSAKTDDS